VNKQHRDFYQSLRTKISDFLKEEDGTASAKYADYLLMAPDMFHLLIRLSIDPDVPQTEKANLALAIAYFISPVDLLPEILVGPIGYLDDVAVATAALNGMINRTGDEIVKKHWAGDKDLLKVIKEVLGVADSMVGSGRWKKIKDMFS
jgi:uncharacterized membrane protein YkvA (DUF1232 family)